MPCPNQCGMGTVAREDLPGHLKDSCSTALVLCPFKDSGCKHRVRRPSFLSVPFLIREAWRRLGPEPLGGPCSAALKLSALPPAGQLHPPSALNLNQNGVPATLYPFLPSTLGLPVLITLLPSPMAWGFANSALSWQWRGMWRRV